MSLPVRQDSSVQAIRLPERSCTAVVIAWVVLTVVATQLYFITVAPGLGWAHLNEDQMISMRVARMLLETGEPYFNRGDPVAANTSLFWKYPLALAHWLAPTPNAAVWGVYWASTAAFTGLAVWTAAHLRGLAAQAAALVLILFSSSALLYGGSEWEHVLRAILVTPGFLEILKGATRERWLLGFYLISLSFLSRPDSAPTIIVAFLAALGTFKVIETNRFDYLSPRDLCVDSDFGLLVRKELAAELQRENCTG